MEQSQLSAIKSSHADVSKPPIPTPTHRKTSEHVPSPTRLEMNPVRLDTNQRSVRGGQLCYKSETLHAQEERIRGFAFMQSGNQQFVKRYFIISSQEKTLAIQQPVGQNWCEPIPAKNISCVDQASDFTQTS